MKKLVLKLQLFCAPHTKRVFRLKRLLRLSLVLLGIVAILAAQPWFTVDLKTGNQILVSGFEALPLLGSALLANAIAVALVLYVHKRWSLFFLLAGIGAVMLALFASLASIFFGQLEILAPFVEKATGVATWLAQIETVIVAETTAGLGPVAWVLMASILLVQFWSLVQALRQGKDQFAARRAANSKTSIATNGSKELNRDLWAETSDFDD